MAYGGRKFFGAGNESVEEKIRRYTKPYPVVTSHLQNNRSSFARNSFNHPLSSIAHQQAQFQFQSPNIPATVPSLQFDRSRFHPSASMSKQQAMPFFRSNNSNNNNINRKRPHISTSPQNSGDLYGKRKKEESECKIKNDKYTQLTEEITSYEKNHTQSKELLDKKLRLRSALLCMIRKQFPGVSLHLVGSSCNGFASDASDADFCVMVNQFRKVDQTHEARRYLKAIERLIRPIGCLKGLQFIAAKVPILKFKDIISGCDCDINVNNATGIRNTHLLRTYSKVDDRVRPLIMAVKKWAKVREINEAKDGTLSSYSLVLMVLHFLQCGCSPPALISLQQVYPNYFKPDSNVDDLPMFEPADYIPCNNSSNKQSVGELLEGFFNYFSERFKWDTQIMSVRLGNAISKKGRSEFRDKYISIEEPFELTNTARAVHQLPRFTLIKKEFHRANNCLNKNLTMESIT